MIVSFGYICYKKYWKLLKFLYYLLKKHEIERYLSRLVLILDKMFRESL